MKYILYCRKSTDTEDKQVLSLDSQEKELLQIAERDNLQIVEILKESKSAKAEGRPVFNEVMKKITKGKADGILCWKLDRLARNFIDGGKIIDSLQRGIIKEIRTYEGIHLPSDNVLMLAVQLGMANQYVRDLSVNVKRGNRAKLERGEWPNHVPFGYVNDKATKTVRVDKVNTPYVVRMFELYATGSYLLREVAEILYKEGLRTNSGKRLYAGNIHRILLRSFYYGMMERDGKYYKGKHEPIISKELYDRVQDVLHGRIHPRTQKYFFPLRGLLKCSSCGCAYTASLKKGHVYYYCTNGKKTCAEHKIYLRSEEADKLIVKKLKEARFDPELIELAYQARKEMLANESSTKETLLENARKALQTARGKESRLLDGYLSGLVAEDIYKAKMEGIRADKIACELEIERIEKFVPDPLATLERTKKVFLTANTASFWYRKAKDEEKRKLLQTLLWNFSMQSGKINSVQYKTPYDLIFKTGKINDFHQLLAVWERVGTAIRQ